MAWSDALTEVFKFFNNIISFKRKKAAHEIMKVVKIYDNMHRVLNETDVERFLVLKAHNGGGEIKVGNEIYASVLYEDYTHPFKSVKNSYQKLQVDKEYTKTLLDVFLAKRIEIETALLPQGLLKTIYLSEGITHAELFFLHQDKKAFYYASVATSKGNAFTESRQRIEIDLAVNDLRNLMNK